MPLRVPTIPALYVDDEQHPEPFVIVMENLTEHSTVFGQVDDPPKEHFVRQIAIELAGLHAAFWQAPMLRAERFGGDRFRFTMHDAGGQS